MSSQKSIIEFVQMLIEQAPIEAVRSLERLETEGAVRVVRELSPGSIARILPHLTTEIAGEAVRGLPNELLEKVSGQVQPHQWAALFGTLPEEERHRIIQTLPEKIKDQVRELFEFPEDSAGQMMRTDFLAFLPHLKVKDAIKKIRSQAKRNVSPSYVYVVDDGRHLLGVITMRDLLLAKGEDKLESIIQPDIFSVDAFMDREELADVLSGRRYFAVPVVDGEKRLLGVVRTEQLISGVTEEASEDILKMFGAGANERSFSPIGFSLRKRLPWLHVNLATAFLAASVVGFFEETIARITILAVFLPVVAGQGGNAGAQSLAVVMRGLVMREIPKDQVSSLILKESLIGIINGGIIGIVTAGVAWLWEGNPFLGVVIGLAMIVNLLAAGFSGAAIPIAMKSIGLDPAQSSSIILTTVTDVVGFFAFLGFAVVFQAYLI